MDNLQVYNAVRSVPANAQKKIQGGRMNGKTDINPMWRIKALTEQFGACGIGWKIEIKRFWLEPGANGEVAAFCEILLYIKQGDTFSNGIPGIGGSAFIAKESKGLYTSDECYKMAYTDAISVACKALGVGADIYWDADSTKYGKDKKEPSPTSAPQPKEPIKAELRKQRLQALAPYLETEVGKQKIGELMQRAKCDKIENATQPVFDRMLEILKEEFNNG